MLDYYFSLISQNLTSHISNNNIESINKHIKQSENQSNDWKSKYYDW